MVSTSTSCAPCEGEVSIIVNSGSTTFTFIDAVSPFLVLAMMVAVPGHNAVTLPFVMVATFSLSELHVILERELAGENDAVTSLLSPTVSCISDGKLTLDGDVLKTVT